MFKNHENKLFRPFIVFVDFESTLVKTGEDERIARHVPNSVGLAFVCSFDPSRNFYKKFSGENFMLEFMRFLFDLAEKCVAEMQKNERMVMTREDWRNYSKATTCHICGECFDCENKAREKVRDHDHLTGKFRGAAHSCCNINYFSNRYLPIFIHNLKNYDSHFIIHAAHAISKEFEHQHDFFGMPINQEKFMCISYGKLRFLDSFQFMASSLEALAQNLLLKDDEQYKFFVNMQREFKLEMDLLCKKGHYPYEWVDDESKFDYVGLPPKEAFYSQLKAEGISDEDYEHALHVYQVMGCKTFRDYHDIYLKTDCLLLADIFQRFREVCHEYYSLDPANYYSAPGLAWDSMLLKTKIRLQLITDTKMLNTFEDMKRGGLCFVGSQRHIEANNKYCDDYDSSKPSTYIMYWDANNLYGGAMSEFLPYDGLRYNNDLTLEDVRNTDDYAEEGHAVRVDF